MAIFPSRLRPARICTRGALVLVKLAVVLTLSGTAIGAQPVASASLTVSADGYGVARLIYSISLPRQLTAEEQSRLEAAIGAQLRVLPDEPDDVDDDDADTERPKTFRYIAGNTLMLRATGLRSEGEIEIGSWLDGLRQLGIQEVCVSVSHPRGLWPSGSEAYRDPLAATPVSETYTIPTSNLTHRVVRLAYGDSGPPAGWRLVLLAALVLVPILVAARMRGSTLRKGMTDQASARFAHLRFVQVVTGGLAVYWWIVFSLLNMHVVLSYRLAHRTFGFQLAAEAGLGVAVPALMFWICELIWAPVRRAAPVRPGIPGDPVRSPVLLFAAGFLPVHLSVGSLFYLSTGHPGLALTGISLAIGCIVLCSKLAAKPGEMDKYELLSPELRARIFDLAGKAGVKLRQVLVLPDLGRRFGNAFATSTNDIWIAEDLLKKLGRREVDAIAAHELGHLRYKHAALRSIALIGPLVLGGAIGVFASESQWDWWPGNLMFPICLLIAEVSFFYFARRFEYSADRFAAGATGDPEAVISGLARLTREKMPLNWSKWDEKVLTHPSTLRRVKRIADHNGIAEERLKELLEFEVTADDRYSLGAGVPNEPAPSLTPQIKKQKTKYALAPLKTALIWTQIGLGGLVFLLTSNEGRGYSASTIGYYVSGLAVFVAAAAWLTARSMKKKLSRSAIADWEFKPEPAELPAADSASFAELSDQLGALGFVFQADFVGTKPSTNLLCLQRLFVNSEAGCYATLSQLAAATLGVTPVICSYISQAADGRRVYTTSGEPDGSRYASRPPGETVLHGPAASPSSLFRIHQERTLRLAQATGFAAARPLSIEAYLAARSTHNEKQKRWVKRRLSMVFLVEADYFNRKPRLEWTRR